MPIETSEDGTVAKVRPYIDRLFEMPYKNLRYFVEDLKKAVPGFEYENLNSHDAFNLCLKIQLKRYARGV